jgi:two-component system sensor histidine kinase ChiS
MIEISLVYLGITITLTLYHFFVFLGRRHETLHLANVLLNVSLMLIILFTIVYPVELMFVLPVGMTPIAFVFFLVTLLGLKKWNRPLFISSVILGAVTGMSMLLRLFVDFQTMKNIFYPFTIAYTILVASLITAEIVSRRLYRDREKLLFVIGVMVAVAGCLVNVVIHMTGIQPPFVVFETLFMLLLVFFSYIITRHFNLEHAQLRELNVKLEQKVRERTRQVEAKEQQKTRFFINLAHETKTPLTLISNYMAAYLQEHGGNRELNIISHNIEKLKLDMINFLDYEKLEKGKIFYNHDQIVNASRLAEMQVKLFRELAAKKKIKVTSDIQGKVYARIDPAAWERVLNNFLDNAIKYTDEKGSVRLTLSVNGAGPVLTVTDTGRGISVEEQNNIWKPFFQLSHQKQNLQGIGMGLNIVRSIMQAVRGRVGVQSAPGKGTTFTVSLPPAAPGPNDRIVEDFRGTSASAVYDYGTYELQKEEFRAGRANVLLVDDNREMLIYLQKKLAEDYNVFCAGNGREALERLAVIPRPHIIISDIMMDDMDGHEFFDQTRRLEALRSVPFIFLTALSSHTEKVRGIEKGAVDYIYKPFSMEELKAKITSLTRVQEALAAENIEALSGRLFTHLRREEAKESVSGGRAPRRAPAEAFRAVSEKYGISQKQMEIIALLKLGLERKEIAWKLNISLNTIKTQMQRIFEKCKIDNKTELLNIFHGM